MNEKFDTQFYRCRLTRPFCFAGFLAMLLLGACKSKPALFKQIPSSHSGIAFNNKIVESDSVNPIDVVNIYNGGGVGIGDFNNDGLPDVYFTGNMVPSKLYLNKGNFKFEDITDASGAGGKGRWARGVSVVDINADGLQDIYICNTIAADSQNRRNILYINEGLKNGVPHFTDRADAYGLAVNVQSTMANFFDYDNDGDLDVYITVNEASNESNPSAFSGNKRKINVPSRGRLYRNDSTAGQSHSVFHDVSAQAGVMLEGYGHAATIADLNRDGWKDIYVSDDFISSNILYINNRNGTFTDRSKEYFKHTSYNAMGQDIVDINNDGLADVFELDMSPPDNYRKKMMLNANNYNTFQNFATYGLQYQYIRNTLQLNQGPRVTEGDSIGAPAFSEISFMSGLAQTDWSWTPLITDFNNDCLRDVIVTNGFPKDVSDHDFIAFRRQAQNLTSKSDLLQHIPEIKLPNVAFQNKGDLRFTNETGAWGLEKVSFSNGAAYADLDNDGDLDLVVNNINDEAFLYRNTVRDGTDTTANYLQVKLEGLGANRDGLGAFVTIYYNGGKLQVFEQTPYRGYLSTNQNMAHFGLGTVSEIDSVVVAWGFEKVQVLQHVKANQRLTLSERNAQVRRTAPPPSIAAEALFSEITRAAGINYTHRDFDFIDFNIQTTLPHKLSEYCPALVAGDVDGNGLHDIIIGGNRDWSATAFLQQKDGRYIARKIDAAADTATIEYKDGGLLLLDVNGDGSLDLYAASAGYKYKPNSPNYNDRLYLNDGSGHFTLAKNALPANLASKLCVRAFDYNGDGKLDLFVSGRVAPWNYPKPVSSFIYRNDSQNGLAKFTDVTATVAPELKNIGLVCDALFTDFDNDGQTDLLLAGEWMPVTFFKNVHGVFKNSTDSSGVVNQLGWWNSIAAGDFRHTGRTDYIVANLGLNSLYQASDAYPVYITAKDFDGNGGYEAVPSLFLPDKEGVLKEFPAHGRDDVIDKMPFLRKRFPNYQAFATATITDVFTNEQRKDALRLKANNLKSVYLRNDGGGRFTMIPLPDMAQVSVLNGLLADDFDGDGHLDVLLNGNDFGTEVSVGRYDALNGLLLKGDGRGGFRPLSILESGIYISGNGKALVKLAGADGHYRVAASQNGSTLKLFRLKAGFKMIPVLPTDNYALITYQDGAVRKEEFYYGASFLSQSARAITITPTMKTVTITNQKGESRTLVL